MNLFYTDILEIFFPKQCLGCNSYGLYICLACESKLKINVTQRCIICQLPSQLGYTHQNCTSKLTPDRLISIFDYHDQLISKVFNTAKLSLVSDLFIELTNIAVNKISVVTNNHQEFVICPIPLTKFKQQFRGFNQSQIIARILGWNLNLAIDPILIKRTNTKQQKKLNAQQRKQNLINSFCVPQTQALPAKVILVDDITTTGSTFIEATKVLKTLGVKEVWCLALAQD